jgi:N-acetylmuramic acid 6-phosphate (MurNAc-6-P) etherase
MNLLKKELYKQLQELEDVKIDRKLNRKEQEIFKKIQNKIEDIDLVIEKKLKKLRK